MANNMNYRCTGCNCFDKTNMNCDICVNMDINKLSSAMTQSKSPDFGFLDKVISQNIDYRCSNCNSLIYDDNYIIENFKWYCDSCIFICELCGEPYGEPYGETHNMNNQNKCDFCILI